MSLYRKNNSKDSATKWLVYTSAGPNSNVDMWLDGKTDFDLWITYFGDYSHDGLKRKADYYNERKGSKWQNLSYVYSQWPQLVKQYSAIFVMDDDIVIHGHQISTLFNVRDKHDLALLQPAFDLRGRISLPITKPRFNSYLRYTNFVECNVPLFKRENLDYFMEVYEDKLIGYGTDHWFSHLVKEEGGDIAIVDGIICRNPHTSAKGIAKREIDELQSEKRRKEIWHEIRDKYNIPTTKKVYKILKPKGIKFYTVNLKFIYIKVSNALKRDLGQIKNKFRTLLSKIKLKGTSNNSV